MEKKGVAVEGLVWWIIAIAILVIIIIVSVVLKDKLFELKDYFKGLFKIFLRFKNAGL